MTVNKDEKEKIRKALKEATPGPWIYLKDSKRVFSNKPARFVASFANEHSQSRDEDKILIINAPEYIQSLLASDDANAETIRQQDGLIEDLQKALAELSLESDGWEYKYAQQAAEIVAKDEEIARLRTEMEESDRILITTSHILREVKQQYASLRECLRKKMEIWDEFLTADYDIEFNLEDVRTLLASLDRKDTQPKEESE